MSIENASSKQLNKLYLCYTCACRMSTIPIATVFPASPGSSAPVSSLIQPPHPNAVLESLIPGFLDDTCDAKILLNSCTKGDLYILKNYHPTFNIIYSGLGVAQWLRLSRLHKEGKVSTSELEASIPVNIRVIIDDAEKALRKALDLKKKRDAWRQKISTRICESTRLVEKCSEKQPNTTLSSGNTNSKQLSLDMNTEPLLSPPFFGPESFITSTLTSRIPNYSCSSDPVICVACRGIYQYLESFYVPYTIVALLMSRGFHYFFPSGDVSSIFKNESCKEKICVKSDVLGDSKCDLHVKPEGNSPQLTHIFADDVMVNLSIPRGMTYLFAVCAVEFIRGALNVVDTLSTAAEARGAIPQPVCDVKEKYSLDFRGRFYNSLRSFPQRPLEHILESSKSRGSSLGGNVSPAEASKLAALEALKTLRGINFGYDGERFFKGDDARSALVSIDRSGIKSPNCVATSSELVIDINVNFPLADAITGEGAFNGSCNPGATLSIVSSAVRDYVNLKNSNVKEKVKVEEVVNYNEFLSTGMHTSTIPVSINTANLISLSLLDPSILHIVDTLYPNGVFNKREIDESTNESEFKPISRIVAHNAELLKTVGAQSKGRAALNVRQQQLQLLNAVIPVLPEQLRTGRARRDDKVNELIPLVVLNDYIYPFLQKADVIHSFCYKTDRDSSDEAPRANIPGFEVHGSESSGACWFNKLGSGVSEYQTATTNTSGDATVMQTRESSSKEEYSCFSRTVGTAPIPLLEPLVASLHDDLLTGHAEFGLATMTATLSRSNIFILGNYKKFMRGMAQSPWFERGVTGCRDATPVSSPVDSTAVVSPSKRVGTVPISLQEYIANSILPLYFPYGYPADSFNIISSLIHDCELRSKTGERYPLLKGVLEWVLNGKVQCEEGEQRKSGQGESYASKSSESGSVVSHQFSYMYAPFYKFHSAGREDIDVRMLSDKGNTHKSDSLKSKDDLASLNTNEINFEDQSSGRPFVLEVTGAHCIGSCDTHNVNLSNKINKNCKLALELSDEDGTDDEIENITGEDTSTFINVVPELCSEFLNPAELLRESTQRCNRFYHQDKYRNSVLQAPVRNEPRNTLYSMGAPISINTLRYTDKSITTTLFQHSSTKWKKYRCVVYSSRPIAYKYVSNVSAENVTTEIAEYEKTGVTDNYIRIGNSTEVISQNKVKNISENKRVVIEDELFANLLNFFKKASKKEENILLVSQSTPLRVMHRRSMLNRKKQVFNVEVVNVINPHWLVVDVTSSAGLYIKEFVHGDMGRTNPNLSTLLESRMDIVQLDVIGTMDLHE